MKTSEFPPNFFIVGAPKCGTTSLANWLSRHPKVYMSPIKEPHFFNIDLSYRNVPEKKKYIKLFDKVSTKQKAIGEASVFYLFSNTAIPSIESCITSPKYIVMVRNPVDMAYSLHEQQLVAGNEHIKEFEKAWEESEHRAHGKEVTSWCREPRLLAYKEVCKLGGQIARLYDLVPKDRVKIVVLDDLKQSPKKEYEAVIRFLGVESDGRSEFPVHNTAKRRKSKLLRRVTKAINSVKQSLGLYWLGTGIMDGLDELNKEYRERPPLSRRVRKRVADYFKDDVYRLSELLSRDLTHWVE